MRNRSFRPVAAMVSVLLLAGGPVHAGPVAISEVIQVIGRYQNPTDLTLRSFSQTASTPIANIDRPTRKSSSVGQSPDSLLSGLADSSSNPQGGVEIITQGQVEGTICDCGEITIPGGGIPKWPLLFLAAIPFFFIHDSDTPTSTPTSTPTLTPTPTPTPTPTRTPPGIPEPATLFLFGTGLAVFGTGMRRRHGKAKRAALLENTAEALS